MKNKTYIIAEAGLNHNGDVDIAKQLIDKAVEIGADAIKFQSYITENFISKKIDQKQFDLLKKFELSFDSQNRLFEYTKSLPIDFLSSPFDTESADFLDKLGVIAYKIASSEITNTPLLQFIAQKRKKVYLSTGMSYLSEVEEAVNILNIGQNQNIVLLHCVSNYPTAYNDVNLKVLETLKHAFNLPIGYSDHTLGIEIPISAVTLGAEVIEKHFTLDCNMEGPDHKLSSDPSQFHKMIMAIRHVESAMGNGIKQPIKNEFPVRQAARKSLFISCDIPQGTILSEEMITTKRPGNGIQPKDISLFIGRKALRKITKDEMILWRDFF